MKTQILKAISLVVLGTFTTVFTACDLLNKATDIDFSTTLEQTFNITEEITGTNVSYSKTLVIDATSDSDIKSYKDKIKGFTINKISYRVISFSGPPTSTSTFSGTLAFGDVSTTASTVSATITNLNLKEAFTSATIYELTFNQADVDKIAALLLDDKAVKIYLNGILSQTPVFCDVNVILDVSFKANVL